jgi:hypothetical protein
MVVIGGRGKDAKAIRARTFDCRSRKKGNRNRYMMVFAGAAAPLVFFRSKYRRRPTSAVLRCRPTPISSSMAGNGQSEITSG